MDIVQVIQIIIETSLTPRWSREWIICICKGIAAAAWQPSFVFTFRTMKMIIVVHYKRISLRFGKGIINRDCSGNLAVVLHSHVSDRRFQTQVFLLHGNTVRIDPCAETMLIISDRISGSPPVRKHSAFTIVQNWRPALPYQVKSRDCRMLLRTHLVLACQ